MDLIGQFLLRLVSGLLNELLRDRFAGRTLPVRAVEKFEVPFGYQVAFDRSVQAVEALERATIVEAHREEGTIVAETARRGWKSGRSLVELSLRGAWNGRVLVTVSSRMTPPVLYDWGQTKRDVAEVRAALIGTTDHADEETSGTPLGPPGAERPRTDGVNPSGDRGTG